MKRMKLWKRKFFLLSATIIVSSFTFISLISCGKTNSEQVHNSPNLNKISDPYKTNYYRPFQFQEFYEKGKNQPLMGDGIAKFSYYQGMSFIFNILIKLGFDLFENDARKDKNGNIINIKYYNDNENKDNIKKAKDVFELLNNLPKIPFWVKWWYKARSTGLHSIEPLGATGHLSDHSRFIRMSYDYNAHLKNISGEFISKKNPLIKFGVPNFYNIIDGANPGRTILGIEVGNYDYLNNDLLQKSLFWQYIQKNKKWSFNLTEVSSHQNIQKFNIMKNRNKINEIKMLVKAIITNLHHQYNNSKKHLMVRNMNSVIQRLYDFISNLNINDTSVWENVNKAVDKLNNGSHSLFGFEIFARGIENLPVRYAPSSKLFPISNEGTINLIGIASSINPRNILVWVNSAKKGKSDLNGEISEVRESFDSHSMLPTKNINEKVVRHGVEIEEMGGLVNREVYKKWWNTWWNENKDIHLKWLKDVNKWESGSKETSKPILKYKSNLQFDPK